MDRNKRKIKRRNRNQAIADPKDTVKEICELGLSYDDIQHYVNGTITMAALIIFSVNIHTYK